MFKIRGIAIAVLVFVLLAVLLSSLPAAINPVASSKEKIEADQEWVNTSPNWLDRQACRWMSLCGLLHLRRDPPTRDPSSRDASCVNVTTTMSRRHLASSHLVRSDIEIHTDNGTRSLRGIPDYVIAYAPLVHLYSDEHFWPSDIDDHVKHVLPYIDDIPMNRSEPLSLSNLGQVDAPMGLLTLKSKDNVECRPAWLHSTANIPVPFEDETGESDTKTGSSERKRFGEDSIWSDFDKDQLLPRGLHTRGSHSEGPHTRPPLKRSQLSRLERRIAARSLQNKPNEKGYSKAPATLILVEKGSGVVDAFWFFFYAYNLGQTVLGTRYGNHVGDWEHTMIRFESGIPRAVYFSEHEGGQAYAWQAVEKRENTERPVIYSAVGSHAMYAMPGDHPYVLPFKMLKDETDHGPLWDPSKNFRSYWYNSTAVEEDEELEPTKENPNAPVSWFYFKGRWGDKAYGLDDERQWRLFGQYHYVTGPQGPKFKNLEREQVCQSTKCRQLNSIAEGRKGSWYKYV